MTQLTLITRKQYMDDSSNLHHAYWSQFVTQGTREYVLARIGLAKLLESKDQYFNDLGIKHSPGSDGTWVWDFAPVNIEKMREAGECSEGRLPSRCAHTCTAKAAARMLAASESTYGADMKQNQDGTYSKAESL